MARPLYETGADLGREQAFIAKICDEWQCESHKLSIKSGADYALTRGKPIVAWVEIKCRTNTKNAFSTYNISLDKLMKLRDLARHTALPAMLCVRWSDVDGYLDIGSTTRDLEFAIWGRYDRGDNQDIEPSVLIPIEEFKAL